MVDIMIIVGLLCFIAGICLDRWATRPRPRVRLPWEQIQLPMDDFPPFYARRAAQNRTQGRSYDDHPTH